MEQWLKSKSLLIGGGILVGLLIVTIIVVYRLGQAYQGGLARFDTKLGEEVHITKTKNLRKITLKRSGSNECIEVSRDGIVRVYSECGGDLTLATRLTNLNAIQKLFSSISQQQFIKCSGNVDISYQVTIESDQGTEIVCLATDTSGTGSTGSGTITDIINQIIGDLPQPSSSTLAHPASPTPGSSPSTPRPSASGAIQPSPSALPSGFQQTFTCDYHETTSTQRPYTVSNIVCSTQPLPIL